jgi:acetolactate synthase I/III small subunit
VSASSIKGVHKYTITCWTTPDVIDKVVTQIEKKIDVIQAHYFTDKEIFQREVAMYKVATPEFQANPEASKVIRRYSAHIVEVNPTFSIVEMVGMSDDITSLYQELKQLNCVLQFVRSGRIAVSTSCFERVNEYLAHREERYQNQKD